MKDKKSPELARASPQQKLGPMKLNVRFSNGGEVVHLSRSKVVDETTLSALEETSLRDSVSSSDSDDKSQTQETSVSIMLIIQVATLVVAIGALIAALL